MLPKNLFCLYRGATALLVAVATPVSTRHSTCYVSQFVPINAHAMWQPRSVAMEAKGKTRNYYSAYNFASTVSFGT